MIDSLEVDKRGYPSDNILDSIRCLQFDGVEEAKRFMRSNFLRLASQLPYGTVRSEKIEDDLSDMQTEIVFATGGWSGCEDFINAVLENNTLRMFYYQWNRGGRHVFRVPIRTT